MLPRLQAGADQVVEAAVLVAAAVLPLYFSLLDTTYWETDKAMAAIAFGIVAGGAWLLGALLRLGQGAHRGRIEPILAAGVFFYAAYVVATLFSIDPRLSLYGAIARHEGLLSHTAYLIAFVAVATRLRTRAQLDRLITVILFAAIPAVVYGALQQFHLDPISSQGDPAVVQWPVRSTFGQHIFFGAYLVLIIPLTAARVLGLWEQRRQPAVAGSGDEWILTAGLAVIAAGSFMALLGLAVRDTAVTALFPALFGAYAVFGLIIERQPDTHGMRHARLWGYSLLLLLEVLVLLFTQARGPELGFVASVPVFLFLLFLRARRPQLSALVFGLTLAAGLFVGLLNLPNGPLQPLRTVHGLNHISNIMQSGGNESSAKGRLEIWRGVVTLLGQQPSVGGTWAGPLRDVVGYGPDTMAVAFQRVFPLKLRQETFEVYNWDRAHDIYLDILEEAGILGLLGLLATAALAVWRVLRTLGSWDGPTSLLAIGLISAIAGHLVEGVFGLETAVTLFLLWSFLGASATLPFETEEKRVPAPRLSAVGWYLGALAVAVGLFLLPADLPNHPILMASVWLLALLAGVGVMAASLGPETRPEVTRRARLPRWATLALAGSALITLLALLPQWQLETAAFADAEGSVNFVRARLQSGLSQAQLATNAAGYESAYRLDLATAYESLARMHGASADPTYLPRPGDTRSLDPGIAVTLGRDQLFTLSVDSVQQAIQLVPMDPGSYATLGEVYTAWGKHRLAYQAFARAEALSLDNPRYLDQEALAQLSLAHSSLALHLTESALQLDRRYWYSYYTLAEVYHRRGQRVQARQAANQGIFWSPVAYPAPPAADLTTLHKIARSG